MPSLGALVNQATSFVADQLDSGTKDGQAIYQSTRVIASFHTDTGFDGAVDSAADNAGGRPSGDLGGALLGSAVNAVSGASGGDGPQPFRIVGLNTQKMFGGQPGTWTLTVKGRQGTDVMRLWPDPEDVWVRIVIVKNGAPTEVMFGLMNTVTENLTRGPQGERSVVYTLQGLDFHKVLTSTQLYINIHENAGQLPIIPLYSAVSENIIGSPDQVLRTVINAWLGNNGVADKQWALPKSLGGGFFFDLLHLDFQECRGRIFDPALYNPDQMMGRTLWQTLEEYANGLLNELYTNTFEDTPWAGDPKPRPQLVLRERPFPTDNKGRSSWESLKTHRLAPGDVKGRKMTRGAPESRFNYWLLDSKGLIGDGMSAQLQIQQAATREKGVPGSAPIYNMDDVRKHGFRRFMQGTRYFPFREDPQWFTHSARWLQLLHDWYIVAPYELSGTLQASAVFPAIRVGHRLLEARKIGAEVTYYVEGVSHDWQYPGPGLTTLNLTRGEFADEDLLALAYNQYSGLGSLLSAAQEAVDLVTGTALGAAVPTGSGPRLDRSVGQIDTPERLYLQQRGKNQGDQTRITRGELQSPDPSRVRQLKPSDLPDQQVSDEAEIAVGRAQPRPRKEGGNLTQRELESGVRLPVKERGIAPVESSKETASEARDRWRKRSRTRGSGTR